MHFYKLGSIPFGINVDDIGMGYDAFCLGNWGIDRYFQSFSVYLTNYGGGLLFIIPADKFPSGAEVDVVCMDKADCLVGAETLRIE